MKLDSFLPFLYECENFNFYSKYMNHCCVSYLFLVALIKPYLFNLSGYPFKMKAFVVTLALATSVVALPTPSQLSQEELRASLITKDNVQGGIDKVHTHTHSNDVHLGYIGHLTLR